MKALSVLVVEDDSIVGMLLGELLELMGYDVCGIEATEAGAVAAAVRCSPDLMIVDVQLSNGSGISAVEEILRTKAIPYVFVSGDISRVQAIRTKPATTNAVQPLQTRTALRTLCLHRGAPWITEKPLLHNDSLILSPMHLARWSS